MNINKRTRRMAFFGIMLAVVTVLSYIEHMAPPLPFFPPNVKLGLSNIVIMYCLFSIGKKDAAFLTLLKSVFVFLIRGPTAGILSLSGGLLSIGALIALSLFLPRSSYVFLSIFGAISHNIGQIAAASFILKYNLLLYYLPVSVIAGIVAGTATGTLLRVTMPLFENMSDRLKK